MRPARVISRSALLETIINRLPSPIVLQSRHYERKLRRAGLALQRFRLGTSEVDCWIGGRGPRLLLLHGFGASAMWQWHGQVGVLARHFSLVVPDLPFFGRSTTESPDRTLGFQAELITSLLDHLDVSRTDLVGLSYGGFVAYLLAHQSPERFGRLVMTSCPGPVITSQDHQELLSRFGLRGLDELLLPDTPEGVRRLLQVAYRRPPPVPRVMLADVHARLFTENVEEKRRLIHALLGEMESPRLESAAVRQPTLVITGEHDAIFPVDLSRRLVSRLGPVARLAVLRRTAHAPNMERIGAYNRVLLDFLGARH